MAHATPWLVLAGSGGVADVLAAVVGQPRLLAPRLVEEQCKEKFPGEHFPWEDIVRWTELVGAPQAPRPVRGAAPIPGWGWPGRRSPRRLPTDGPRPVAAKPRARSCPGPARGAAPPPPRPARGATLRVLLSQLQNIASHSHLLTVYDFEQEGSEELDTVILKALVKGEGPPFWEFPSVSCRDHKLGLLPCDKNSFRTILNIRL